MDEEEKKFFTDLFKNFNKSLDEKLDIMHTDIARLIKKINHPRTAWMNDAIEFVKEREIVFMKELYSTYGQLNNGYVNKIFYDLLGHEGIVKLTLFAKGNPSFLFYKKSTIAPIFLKLWQTQYTTKKVLYIGDLEPDDRQAFREWFEKQPLFIKFFIKTDDMHYAMKREAKHY